MIHVSDTLLDKLLNLYGSYDRYLDTKYQFDWISVADTDPTRLSGIPRNKNLERWPDARYREEVGVYLRPGKFLKALGIDGDPELLAEELREEINSDKLEICQNPSEVYAMDHDHHGPISESCMRHKPRSFFEIYDDAPECSILYLEEGGILLGRALLWEIDDQFIMDRIYYNNHLVFAKFKAWAKDHHYFRKAYQNYDTPRDFINPQTGAKVELQLSLDLPGSSYEAVPFCDTFKWHDGEVWKNTSADYSFDSTEGDCDYLVGSRLICDCCDCIIQHDDDHTTVDNSDIICSSCLDNYYFYCDYCEEYHRDNYRFTEAIDFDEPICQYCAENNFTLCPCCGVYKEEEDFEIVQGEEVAGEVVLNSKKTVEICKECFLNYESEYEDKDMTSLWCKVCDTNFMMTDDRWLEISAITNPESEEYNPNITHAELISDECETCKAIAKRRQLKRRLQKAVEAYIDKRPYFIQNSEVKHMFFHPEVHATAKIPDNFCRVYINTGNKFVLETNTIRLINYNNHFNPIYVMFDVGTVEGLHKLSAALRSPATLFETFQRDLGSDI